jgi:copper(I)-binding protein
MRIRNDTDQTRRVVSASSDVSKVTELHTHIHDNGVMRMRRVKYIEIPAHGTVALQPGGYHVMLIGLKHPLKPGDPVHIDLTLDDGEVVPIDLKARKIGMHMNMHGMHMPMK